MPSELLNNLPVSIGITGALNVPALQAAVEQLVLRHARLRANHTDLPHPLLGVIQAPPISAMGQLSDWESRPFALPRDLPFRARLFAITSSRHVLSMVIHRSAIDAWSVPQLLRDLSLAYAASAEGNAISWDPIEPPAAQPSPGWFRRIDASRERLPLRINPGMHKRLLGAGSLATVLRAAWTLALASHFRVEHVPLGVCQPPKASGAFAGMQVIKIAGAEPVAAAPGDFRVSFTLHPQRPAAPHLPGLVCVLSPMVAAFGPADAAIDLCELRSATGAPEGIEGIIEFDPDAIAIHDITAAFMDLLHEAAGMRDREIPPAVAYVPPRNALQHQLLAHWENRFGVTRIGMHDDFFALGGSPRERDAMLQEMDTLYRTKLSAEPWKGPLTVDHLCDGLLRSLPPSAHPVRIQRGDPAACLPLFILHGDFSGGGYYVYELARYLGVDQPVYSMAPHGLDGHDIPATVEEMARDQLARLRAFQPHGPYCLSGYCNGALVAFEMARLLAGEGESVPLLALIDGPAPWAVPLRAPEEDPGFYRAPAEWRTRPAVRGHWVLNQYIGPVRRFHPKPYPGKVVLLCSNTTHTPHAPEGGIQRAWERVAVAAEVHKVSGDHTTCISRYLPELAAILRPALDAASVRYALASGASSSAATAPFSRGSVST